MRAAALILGLFAIGAAHAQEAIPTATDTRQGGAPATTSGPPIRLPDRAVERYDDGPHPVGPCGAVAKTAGGKPDRAPHGDIHAGVGTRGYREIGGVVCTPIGDKGAMVIAVDAATIDGRRGGRR